MPSLMDILPPVIIDLDEKDEVRGMLEQHRLAILNVFESLEADRTRFSAFEQRVEERLKILGSYSDGDCNLASAEALQIEGISLQSLAHGHKPQDLVEDDFECPPWRDLEESGLQKKGGVPPKKSQKSEPTVTSVVGNDKTTREDHEGDDKHLLAVSDYYLAKRMARSTRNGSNRSRSGSWNCSWDLNHFNEDIAKPKTMSSQTLSFPIESHSGSWYAPHGANVAASAESKAAPKPTLEANIMDRRADFKFSKSIWDLSIFVFHEELRWGTSCFICLLLIMNVCFQLAFCVVINKHLTESSIDENTVTSARAFRTRVGHHQQYRNVLTGASLVERICENSPDLELGTSQLLLLQSIHDYIGYDLDGSMFDFFDGAMMCTLALLCWGMCIMSEMINTVNEVVALYETTNRGLTTQIVFVPGGLRLQSLSVRRFIFACGICCLRFLAAVYLAAVGALQLAAEIDVAELFLNAIALKLVMNVDELVFSCFAPDVADMLIARLRPLKRSYWSRRLGVESRAVIAVVLVASYVVYTVCEYVVPLKENMEDVVVELCDGHRNFVYGVDTIGMILIDPSPNLVRKDQLAAVESAMAAWTSMNSTRFNVAKFTNETLVPIRWGHDFQWVLSMSHEEMIDKLYNGPCYNVITPWHPFPMPFFFLLRRRLDLTDEQLLHFDADPLYVCDYLRDQGKCDIPLTAANNEEGILIRALCPGSCNCRSPLSTTPSHLVRFGCPSDCMTHLNYISQLNEIPCRDLNATELAANEAWNAWMDSLQSQMGDREMIHDRVMIDLADGCEGILRKRKLVEDRGMNLDEPTYDDRGGIGYCWGTMDVGFTTRPMATICPVACGCMSEKDVLKSELMQDRCPQQCFSGFSDLFHTIR